MTANTQASAPVDTAGGDVPDRQTDESPPICPIGDDAAWLDAPVSAVGLDDWEFDDEVDSARWLVSLSHARLRGDGPHVAYRSVTVGIDPPAGRASTSADEDADGTWEELRERAEPGEHPARTRFSDAASAYEEDAVGGEAASAARSWSTFGWFVTTLGLSAVACGSILAGWSLWGSRSELWHVGLPMALAGQVAAVIGLMLLVDSPSRRQRTQSPRHCS